MRSRAIVFTLVLVVSSDTYAWGQQGGGTGTDPEYGCLMMSDGTAASLALTREQLWQVHKSDERCLNACARSDTNPFGKVDTKAMAKHQAEMKKILNAEQYARWLQLCSMSKAELGTDAPLRDNWIRY